MLPAHPLLLLPRAVLQGGSESGAPGWMAEAAFWIALASLVAAALAAAGIWSLVVHVRQLRDRSEQLGTLETLDQKLGRLVADRDDLDLRRIEHVLIDLRDAQKRLEEAFLRASQIGRGGGAEPTSSLAVQATCESIGERVVNRLLSLGYEQVQIVTRAEKLTELLRSDGEVLVEARREGVLFKGRALLRGGRLTDVEMNPAYSIFP